jgi:hypothetical protein
MWTDLPFDLVLLMLRVVFIFLLYFFLYQVVRVISRELASPPAVLPARAAGPAAPGAQPSLTLIDADQSELPLGATFALQPVTSVGRAADNQLPLPDAFVSSHHARLVQTNGRWYVTDLGSTNGTFVNGNAAGPVAMPVANGDVVQFGRVKFRLSLPA